MWVCGRDWSIAGPCASMWGPRCAEAGRQVLPQRRPAAGELCSSGRRASSAFIHPGAHTGGVCTAQRSPGQGAVRNPTACAQRAPRALPCAPQPPGPSFAPALQISEAAMAAPGAPNGTTTTAAPAAVDVVSVQDLQRSSPADELQGLTTAEVRCCWGIDVWGAGRAGGCGARASYHRRGLPPATLEGS